MPSRKQLSSATDAMPNLPLCSVALSGGHYLPSYCASRCLAAKCHKPKLDERNGAIAASGFVGPTLEWIRRPLSPAVRIARFVTRVLPVIVLVWRRRITRLAGASGGRVRPITEACGRADRSERSKVKLKGLARIHLQQAPRPGRRRRKMSAVARPTFVVVASLLANRATANNDDDDDESNEHLSYAVWIALGLFIILFLLFDLLRTRMWWVYEPRLHHDSYRARTPHAPDRGAEASCWALRRSNF